MWTCTIAVAAALFWSALPAAASAQIPLLQGEPHAQVGVSDNSSDMFGDQRFLATGIRHVRLIVPYDVVRTGGWQLAEADRWLTGARERRLEPLVSFAYSGRRGKRWRFHLPKVAEYGARLREFRTRYPWVREFSTWNEANHEKIQPTGKRPGRTARLYRELRRQCAPPACRALAVDMLLTGARRHWRWLRKFRRYAGPGPHTWGVHNYPDVNRLRGGRTASFLRRVGRDEVWFTETGGIVKFGHRWRRNERRAGQAVRHAFKLAELSPRITRLYLYNWREVPANKRWDSALISWDGRPRDGYFSLMDALSRDRFRILPP
jgi:hypothetical protein